MQSLILAKQFGSIQILPKPMPIGAYSNSKEGMSGGKDDITIAKPLSQHLPTKSRDNRANDCARRRSRREWPACPRPDRRGDTGAAITSPSIPGAGPKQKFCLVRNRRGHHWTGATGETGPSSINYAREAPHYQETPH